MFSKFSKFYSQVPQDEQVDGLPSTAGKTRARSNNTSTSIASALSTAYILCLHFVTLLLAGLLLARHSSYQYSSGSISMESILLPSELRKSPYNASAIQMIISQQLIIMAAYVRNFIAYEDVKFDPSGFTNDPTLPFNPYLGVPGTETDAFWEKLYNVGMVVLNAEEAAALPMSTTPLIDMQGQLILDSDNQEQYLVTLEVFHQLHCLDYLRHASYSRDGNHHPGESEWSKSKHLDHCSDYLRQVLMCHGDMTPITLDRTKWGMEQETRRERDELPVPPFKPDFAIMHTCRNWDLIYEFALQRNTSTYTVA
ncbi:hypothetical protein F5884DRAFT_889025 [Xylogone sp. PMI_703]|nr:hypothetical protein F5884DRAFT_889025 [Xylogone sp. PMI_703]